MTTIDYEGRNVYTQPNKNFTLKDVVSCEERIGKIEGAHFFRDGIYEPFKRSSFNKERIENNESGLAIRVGGLIFHILGLNNIHQFLENYGRSTENLAGLRRKKVTTYTSEEMELIGISLLEK